MSADPAPIFAASHYEYRVSLGTVQSKSNVRWNGGRYNCRRWEHVETLVEMWEETCDTPAVEVDLDFRGEPELP